MYRPTSLSTGSKASPIWRLVNEQIFLMVFKYVYFVMVCFWKICKCFGNIVQGVQIKGIANYRLSRPRSLSSEKNIQKRLRFHSFSSPVGQPKLSKNPAYRRHWISQCVRIVAPIPKPTKQDKMERRNKSKDGKKEKI